VAVGLVVAACGHGGQSGAAPAPPSASGTGPHGTALSHDGISDASKATALRYVGIAVKDAGARFELPAAPERTGDHLSTVCARATDLLLYDVSTTASGRRSTRSAVGATI
jgi:hypothetical protein